MGAQRDVPAGQAGGDPTQDGLSISRSNALIPLLLLFAATILATVATIVLAEPFVPHEGAPADRAYGPHDFPAIFAEDTALLSLTAASGATATALFPVPAPPFSEDVFPCMECHKERASDPERRAMRLAHDEITLRHDEEHRWCLDCHDAQDRDRLRLASGALVPFTESYRLCGQCHGTQFRDWRSGIHGKRTGFWDGPKRYLLCVHCHNPHDPRFAPLEPLPPPIRPQYLREDAPRPSTESAHADHAR